jgi:EmrB/QacA subfamily drug resistance transporter
MENKNNFKWWVLLTVIIGTFLGGLNQTVANLALPKIINEFGISVAQAGWISTAYIIANAVLVPVWGKMGDLIGRKKVYLAGFSIFILGSTLVGFAWNFGSMIVFRVIQAVAVSADYPTAMAIIAVTFKDEKERAGALGIWSSSFAISAVLGPLIGGPIIDTFGWRYVFFMVLPIGILGIIMTLIFVNESISGQQKKASFDLLGAILLGVALTSLVLVLEKGMDWGWLSANSIIAYTITISFGIMFWLVERNHKEPIIDFKFFKNNIFVGTLINNFIVFMGMMGGMFLIPIFVQTFLGYNATQSGYLFIPMAVFMMAGAQIGSRLTGKVKANYVIFASTLVASIGIFMFSLFIDPRSSALDIIIPLSVMAFGLGFGMSQRTSLITFAVPQHEVGIASSVLALARNIAGAFGIAIFATILNSAVENHVISMAQNTIITVLNPTTYGTVAALIILKAQVAAYITVFQVSAFIVFIGAIAALFIKIEKNQKQASSAGNFIH